ncbi:MAG: zf-TFIIB domain-containing protein [Chloroflexota bacterium]|jgi:Zn-finger nucleic acid-binding protein|nr:zf-TFIIB domain-containing protein [Chloroflexota bacterium]
MRCPKDDTELLQSERQGIEIEYCPTCNGAWVDRGDLDELIATAAAAVPDDDDLFDDDDETDIDQSRRRADTSVVWDDARPRKDKRKGYRRELTRGAVEF